MNHTMYFRAVILNTIPWKKIDAKRPRGPRLYVYQLLLLIALFAIWHVLTATNILPPLLFGRPLVVLQKVWEWFASGKVYSHLAITLVETVLAFAVGTLLGLAAGLWLALSPWASALFDPYIKGFNAMPSVILAPIFAVWFGLGIWSKVALVFFIVFFNVFQGVREVSPVVLANARMLGAGKRQLLRHVHLPSATS